ncbi:hypothetical protein [Oryzobacter terrae]|uniref:hypothetical protein n=1 Tax=Oryzobacter terrae TaxID=1620385 RepID=UPI00366BF370
MRRHTLTVLASAATLGALVVATQPAVATAAPAPAAAAAAAAAIAPTGAYTPLTPARLLDTRRRTGVTTTTPIGAGKSIDLQVTGRGGVPTAGVSAVVLNLTAVAPTRRGYLTAHPATMARPTASSINFNAGWTGANLVTVPIGTGGKVRIFNAAGLTHAVADVVGYYHSASSTSTALGSYEATDPTRLVDTRLEQDWGRIPLGPQEYLWASVDFEDVDFNARVEAVALNVTAVAPTRQGHITVFNGDGPSSIPATSTLNFAAGRTVPNMSIVKVGHCSPPECELANTPRFGVANASTGAVHIVVDVVGVYFTAQEGDSGWRFKSLSSPRRFVDSRLGQGLATNLGSNVEKVVTVPSTIAGPATRAVVTNTTAAQPTVTTVLTLWPAGIARPTVSNLNPYAGQVVSNMTITQLTGADFRVHNRVGTTPLVIDAAGTFEDFPTGPVALRGATGLATDRPSRTAPTSTVGGVTGW